MPVAEMPREITADLASKAVILDPAIKTALPGIEGALQSVDHAFLKDPEAYLTKLENSVFTFESSQGADVTGSFLYDEDSIESDEWLVIVAPFSNTEPKSTATELLSFMEAGPTKGALQARIDHEKAAPNSWTEITKSAVVFELLKALDKGMPVLTIFSPLPPKAYSAEEEKKIADGDFSPTSRIITEAIGAAKRKMLAETHELPPKTKKLHLGGSSLGAIEVISAGGELENVQTVTGHEAIMSKHLGQLATRFTIRQNYGQPSTVLPHVMGAKGIPSPYSRALEPALRRQAMIRKSEFIGTNLRMVQGMKIPYLRGLTNPEQTIRATEKLLENGVDVLLSVAENSSITRQMAEYLSGYGGNSIIVRGENGQRIAHQEFVTLSGLILALNIMRNDREKKLKAPDN